MTVTRSGWRRGGPLGGAALLVIVLSGWLVPVVQLDEPLSTVVLDQQGCRYVPHVLGVVVDPSRAQYVMTIRGNGLSNGRPRRLGSCCRLPRASAGLGRAVSFASRGAASTSPSGSPL